MTHHVTGDLMSLYFDCADRMTLRAAATRLLPRTCQHSPLATCSRNTRLFCSTPQSGTQPNTQSYPAEESHAKPPSTSNNLPAGKVKHTHADAHERAPLKTAHSHSLSKHHHHSVETHRHVPDPLSQAGSPWFFLACATGFGLTAWDTFSPSAPNILPAIDEALHLYAKTLDPAWRKLIADILLSDTFIAIGLLGWASCTVAAAISKKPKAVASVTLAWAAYAWGAGPLMYDPWVVDILKNSFERIRPTPDYHTSFSFPSGHTSSATFTIGALLFVLIPTVLGRRRPRKLPPAPHPPQNRANTNNPPPPPPTITITADATGAAQAAAEAGAVAHTPAEAAGVSSQLPPGPGGRLLPGVINAAEGNWALWGVACMTTGAGRVLADAHWFSDTLAATCLGGCLVSVLAFAVNKVVHGNVLRIFKHSAFTSKRKTKQ